MTNNPLRYTDPTGHRCVEDGFEGSCTATENKTTKKWKDDNKDRRQRSRFLAELRGLGSGQWACSGSNQSTLCLPASSSGANTPIDIMSNFPAQCTSTPCIGNFVPSVTPTPTSTPLPIISSEDANDLTQYWVPSNPLKPNFAPNLDEVWHNLANGVPPLFGVPGIDVTVKRIVDGIPNAIETANNVLVNYSAYVISGGMSPTIPIVPYFPSANPFGTVYQ